MKLAKDTRKVTFWVFFLLLVLLRTATTARAVNVSYLDAAWNDTTKTVDFTEKTCADYTPVTSDLTAWGAGWYVVNDNVTIASRVTVTGDVHLILCDGKTLTANEGITVNANEDITDNTADSFTIYAQSNGTDAGALTIPTGVELGAGIGGLSRSEGGYMTECQSGGTITINGGKITTTGGQAGAGIGGGYGGGGGTITINGGTVNAYGHPNSGSTGGSDGAGIGGGQFGNGGTITINGGTVTAQAGMSGAGIGSANGSQSGQPTSVTINGGTVTATGGMSGAGIGGGYSGNPGTLTLGDGMGAKAGDDAASAVVVSDFSTNHAQKYAYVYQLSPWELLQKKLSAGGEITLTEDVTASAEDTALEVPSGKTVTLDLNGHTIDRALTAATSNGYVIKVSGTLTVKDSGTGGKITGGNNSGNGGGVFVDDGGAFTMESGEISGNTAYNGGGVVVNNGTFEMSGGTISGNTAGTNGGGVYVNSGAFKLSGSPTITGNVKGGTITGGVLSGGTAENVYLENGNVITISATLDAAASVGVTTETAPTADSPVTITSGLSGKGAASNFVSDAGYTVKTNDSGEAYMDGTSIISNLWIGSSSEITAPGHGNQFLIISI